MRWTRLTDGLVVALARRVQRWADRILAERDGASRAPWQEPPEDPAGPPAHWLEMVRARAPRLLSELERAPRRGSPPPRTEPPRPPRSTAAGAPAAVPARADRDASGPAPAPPVSVDAPAERRPAELEEGPPRSAPASAPTSASDSAGWSRPDARSSPVPSPAPSPVSLAATAPPGAARNARVDAALASTTPDGPAPPREPTSWRWRFAPAPEEAPAHRRVESPRSPDRSVPERHPLDGARAERRTPVHLPAALATPRARVPEARPPAAPGLASSSAAPPAPASPPALPSPAHRPGAGSLEALAPDKSPPGALRPGAPPSGPFAATDGSAAPSRWELPPAQPGLWPRLPDEGDDTDQAPTDAPPRARPRGPTWPALPGDDLLIPEPPASGEDAGRRERLHREQRGARWSERRS